jgi:hypothetical protein
MAAPTDAQSPKEPVIPDVDSDDEKGLVDFLLLNVSLRVSSDHSILKFKSAVEKDGHQM